ncbi:hypothetical protein [Tolypothrix sp. VBCCA 56010]
MSGYEITYLAEKRSLAQIAKTFLCEIGDGNEKRSHWVIIKY